MFYECEYVTSFFYSHGFDLECGMVLSYFVVNYMEICSCSKLFLYNILSSGFIPSSNMWRIHKYWTILQMYLSKVIKIWQYWVV